MTQKKSITILGSTGSVGVSTLDLVDRNPNLFSIVGLTAHRNVKLLAEQAITYKAQVVAIADEAYYSELVALLSGHDIEILAGTEAVSDVAAMPSDFLMASIVGYAGLQPTLAAVKRGAVIGLANKECLVSAGALMMAEVAKHGATILPVDSEHNAIFQVFDFEQVKGIQKIILTASGGPFWRYALEDFKNITPKQAVAHPNWDMGAKISVDSATMMNKGLEMIEAFHLFPITEDQIDVIVHPQSVVHSMVEYIDGSVLAQMGTPDMRTPIAYVLGYPERIYTPSQRLNFAEMKDLSFEAPDDKRFPCLKLAREAMQAGGAQPTILNAANEVAVAAFLAKKIRFIDISALVNETLMKLDMKVPHSLTNVYEIDAEARRLANSLAAQYQI